MDNNAIKVENLNKAFKLPHEKKSSVKGLILSSFHKRTTYERQKVLDDISFEIKKGEFFGIVGRNGSGKSTLLKLLAGIYSPDSGSIHVNGSLTPFIELGVGFNPDLTGRENVFLNGALLGFNRKDMLEMYDDIVEFAELERFMDQKLKNYSSGMQVRLAFSIAIRAKSDILLIDEVLAVGDAAFQKKCFDVFRVLKKEKRTIILVTHDMGNVERFCDRALVINNGKQIALTTPAEVSAIYSQLNIDDTSNSINTAQKKRWGYGGVRVKSAKFMKNNSKTTSYSFGDKLKLSILLERDNEHKKVPVICGISIFNQDDVNISGPNSAKYKLPSDSQLIEYEVKELPLAPGEYFVTIALYDDTLTTPFDVLDKTISFNVTADHVINGIIQLDDKWSSGKIN